MSWKVYFKNAWSGDSSFPKYSSKQVAFWQSSFLEMWLFSCRFPALFGRSSSPDPHAWDIALGSKSHWAFLIQSLSICMDCTRWTDQQEGFFVLLGGQATHASWWADFQWLHALPPLLFFLLKHCWGTGINDLTSKGRSIWTRHSLSQPGAAGSLVYPKYKAPGILETGRGSKTKLAGHSG